MLGLVDPWISTLHPVERCADLLELVSSPGALGESAGSTGVEVQGPPGCIQLKGVQTYWNLFHHLGHSVNLLVLQGWEALHLYLIEAQPPDCACTSMARFYPPQVETTS